MKILLGFWPKFSYLFQCWCMISQPDYSLTCKTTVAGYVCLRWIRVPFIVCPLADQYDVFVDWEFFSMCTDLIRCAGRGHLTVDVLWKNFEIWMGQLKVKVIHASITHKVLSKIMCGFGLDCVKLSGYSGRKAWQLNTIQTKSAHGLVAFCSTFLSDGGMNHLNF